MTIPSANGRPAQDSPSTLVSNRCHRFPHQLRVYRYPALNESTTRDLLSRYFGPLESTDDWIYIKSYGPKKDSVDYTSTTYKELQTGDHAYFASSGSRMVWVANNPCQQGRHDPARAQAAVTSYLTKRYGFSQQEVAALDLVTDPDEQIQCAVDVQDSGDWVIAPQRDTSFFAVTG